MLPPDLPQDLHARYIPEVLLGQGGFGRVVRARDRQLGRRVAIKLLHVERADEEARLRFVREGQRTAALRHPHIVEIFEAGVAGGDPYLVYEFVPGDTLAARARLAPPTEPLAMRWAGEVAGALAAVHRAGLLHRDLKPENVLVREDDSLVLTDFGLVRDLVDRDHLTATGMILGTPAFMPPELWLGELPDALGDQFSWAATLVKVLADHFVYGTRESSLVFDRVLQDGELDLPASLASRYPRLTPVLRRALRRHPRERFPDMDAFVDALEAGGGEAMAEAGFRPASRALVAPGLLGASRAQPVGPTTPRGTPLAPGARRRTLLRTALAFGGAVLVGVMLPGGPEAPPAAPPASPSTAPAAPPEAEGPTPEELGARLEETVEAVRQHILEGAPGEAELDELVQGEDHPGVSGRLSDPQAAPLRFRWFQSLRRWIGSAEVRRRLGQRASEAPREAALWARSAMTLRTVGAAHVKLLRRYSRYKAVQGLGLAGEVDEAMGEAVVLFREDLGGLAADLDALPDPRPPHVDALRAVALYYQDAPGRARAARQASRALRGTGFYQFEPTLYLMLFKVAQAPVIGDEPIACDTFEGVLDDLAQPALGAIPKEHKGDARRYLADLAAIVGMHRVRCEQAEPAPIAERLAARLEDLAGRSTTAAAQLRLASERLRDGKPGPRGLVLAARFLVLAERLDKEEP